MSEELHTDPREAVQDAADFPYCVNPLCFNVWRQGIYGNLLLVNAPSLPSPAHFDDEN